MAVIQAPKSGGGLFGNIGSTLASMAGGPIAPWIMAANAIYNASQGNWGNALGAGLGAFNGFSPEKALLGGAAASLSGNGGTGNVKLGAWNPQGAAESVPQTWEHPNEYSLVWRR